MYVFIHNLHFELKRQRIKQNIYIYATDNKFKFKMSAIRF